MADRPDPGKPEVPQLRRFRMDPDGSGRAHEIEPTQQLPAPGAASASYDDPAYDDPDALLRETDADLGPGWQPTDAPPVGAAAAADQTRRLPDSLEPRRPEPPVTAAAWDQPPGGPPTGPVGEDPDGGKRRNLVPIVIAAIAALAIIGLLLWFFVFSPSGDNKDQAPTSETQTTQSSEQSEQSSEPGTQSEGDDSEGPGRDDDDGVRESGGGIAPTTPGDDNDDSNDDSPQSDSNDDGSTKSGQPTMPGGTDRN